MFLAFSSPCFAGTYWVGPSGSATWANCQSATDPGSGNYCGHSTANYYAVAGDTIYLADGTYTRDGGNDYNYGIVAPRNDGTRSGSSCSAWITYTSPPSTTSILDGANGIRGLHLVSNQCVRVTNLNFRNGIGYYGWIRSTSYVQIDNNTFEPTETASEVGFGLWFDSQCSPNYNCWNTHNWVHHNVIGKKRNGETCGEGTDLIRIGDDNSGIPGADMSAANDYNTVENNELRYASHTPLENYGNYVVIRNNFIHNEPWWAQEDSSCNYPNDYYTNAAYDGKYGHRAMQITDGYQRDRMYNLIESNRVGMGSTNPGNNGADCVDIAGPGNVFRYNDLYGAMNSCLMFKYGWGLAVDGNGGTYNRVYNNTMFKCGYGNNEFYELGYSACIAAGGGNCSTTPQAELAIRWYRDTTYGNILKNNLVYDSRRYALSGFDLGMGASDSTIPGTGDTANILVNNWMTPDGDPTFTSTTIPTTAVTTNPLLTLQSSSDAIDGGTSLTLASGSGISSTTLVVDDALFFQDGSWGSNLAKASTGLGGTLEGDWIAVGTVSNVVQISSINYATNTITLASAITWSDDAPVWLYKKSDGTQVLYGTAPDYGAHEYVPLSTSAPTLRGGIIGRIQ